jgi:hypothetical protein
MDHPVVVVVLTLVVVFAVNVAYLFVVGKGSLSRLGLAWQAFNRVMGDAAVAEQVQTLLTPPPAEDQPKRPSPEPLRFLTLLQREGRVIDFLLEDISSASDDQIGAAVRELHRKAQEMLREHLTLEPVLAGAEGDQVEVPAGFDPSAVQLTGNVTGQPPFRGELQHHGWRVKDYRLPTPPEGQDLYVLAPAQVDLP